MATTSIPSAVAGVLVALHGWTLSLPEGWELAGTTGHERRGWLLLARDRQPVVRMAWRQHAVRPDLERSLDRAGAEVCRRGGCRRLTVRRAPDDQQRWGEWDGPAGTWHAAVRTFPGTGLTLAATALMPGLPVGGLVATARALPGDAAWRWCAYGLDVHLPAWWRLVGIQTYAGLTRAVWGRRPSGGARTDQMLVLRRIACASRLLAGGDPGAWLLAGLDGRERMREQDAAAGVWRMTTARPAANWWRRWRGGSDVRVLHAWIEEDADRLLVQEWRGDGDPLPCLRQALEGVMA